MSGPAKFEENTVCDACGCFGAFDFGREHLCVDCYEGRGSCCSEFSGNDLCNTEEPSSKAEEKKAPQQQKH